MSSLHDKVSAVVESMQSGALAVHDGPPLDDPNYVLVGKWIRNLKAALEAHPEGLFTLESDRVRLLEKASDKWRTALEELQGELAPGSDQLQLTDVPRAIRAVIRNGVACIKNLERQLAESGGYYTSAVREKAEAQKEAARLRHELAETQAHLSKARVALQDISDSFTYNGKESPDPWRAIVVRAKQYVGLVDTHSKERDEARDRLWNFASQCGSHFPSKAQETKRWLTLSGYSAFAGRLRAKGSTPNVQELPKPGELCKPCREARAVEHYHGTPARYCERCAPLQAAAVEHPGTRLLRLLHEQRQGREFEATKLTLEALEYIIRKLDT